MHRGNEVDSSVDIIFASPASGEASAGYAIPISFANDLTVLRTGPIEHCVFIAL